MDKIECGSPVNWSDLCTWFQIRLINQIKSKLLTGSGLVCASLTNKLCNFLQPFKLLNIFCYGGNIKRKRVFFPFHFPQHFLDLFPIALEFTLPLLPLKCFFLHADMSTSIYCYKNCFHKAAAHLKQPWSRWWESRSSLDTITHVQECVESFQSLYNLNCSRKEHNLESLDCSYCNSHKS